MNFTLNRTKAYVALIFLWALSILPHHSNAQVNINAKTFYAGAISAQAEQTIFRIHMFKNDGGGTLTGGDIFLEHILNPADDNLGFRGVRISTGPVDLEAAPGGWSYSPVQDPFALGQPLNDPSMNTSAVLNSGAPAFGATSFIQSGAPAVMTNFNLGPQEFVYIVEILEVSECPLVDSNPQIVLEVTFQGPSAQNLCTTGGTTCFHPSGGNVAIAKAPRPTLGISYQSHPTSGSPSTVNALANGAGCDDNDIARRLVYTINDGSVEDPQFRLTLNFVSEIQLFEVDPTSIKISIAFDTDGVGGNDLFINDMTLADLVDDVNSNFNYVAYDNAFQGNRAPVPGGGAGGPYNDANVADNAPFVLGITPISKSPNGIALKRSLSGDPADFTFVALVMNFSNFSVTSSGTGSMNTQPDYALGNYLTIYEGSTITVDYTGTLMNYSDFGDGSGTTVDYTCYRDIVPRLHTHAYYMSGADHCQRLFLARPSHANFTRSKPEFVMSAAPGAFLKGSSDTDYDNWDGEVTTMEVDMPPPWSSGPGLHGLNLGGSSDPLDVDWEASTMEFHIELDRGLSIPCPNSPANTITGLNVPHNTGTGFCHSANFGDPNHGFVTNVTYNDPTALCGDPSSAFGLVVDPHDVFYIEIGNGDTIFADQIHIEPLETGNCEAGQRWVIQIPMNRFWGRTSIMGNSFWLLGSAKMKFTVQGYCPSNEPEVEYRVRAFVIPEYCNAGGVTAQANPYNPSPITYFHASCANPNTNTCSTSPPNDPPNKWFVGETASQWFVTCPGCITPGVAAIPSDPLRHPDFRGWADYDDDGSADAGLNPAHVDSIDRGVIRHGDVMSMNVHCYLYDPVDSADVDTNMPIAPVPPPPPGAANCLGAPTAADFATQQAEFLALLATPCLWGPGDEFSAGDLANPNLVDYPNATPLYLNKWVFDLDITPGGTPSGRQIFYPLIKDATNPGTGSTSIFEVNDDMDYDEYFALAQSYPSTVLVRYIDNGGVPRQTTYTLKESDFVWRSSGYQMRIALDINTLWTALINDPANSGLSDPTPTFFEGTQKWKLDYQLEFITDVDQPAYTAFFQSGHGNPAAGNTKKQSIAFHYDIYVTDADIGALLHPTSSVELDDHPDEYEEALHIDCDQTATTGTRPSTKWWCEAGGGMIELASYADTRYMQNQDPSFDTERLGYETTAILGPAELSPCTEVGPTLFYNTGSRGSASANHFPKEIRPGSLTDSIIFYVPAPFKPEAVLVRNYSQMNDGLAIYDGSIDSRNLSYLIPLAGPNALQTDPNAAGFNNLGITVSLVPSHVMPDEFYPVWAVTPTVPPIPDAAGSGNPGDPIVGIPPLAEKVQHWKVAIPVEFFHEADPAVSFPADGLYHLSPSNQIYPAGTNVLPMVIGDEHQQVRAAIYYSMPVCSGQDPSDDQPYTDDCTFRPANNSNFYYDGSPANFLNTTFGTTGFPRRVNPVRRTSAGLHNALTVGDFAAVPNLHPSFEEFRLMMPSCISSLPLEFASPASPTTITTFQVGVNNHVLDFDALTNAQDMEKLFSGAVPATRAGGFQLNTAGQGFGYTFFDQRSDIHLNQTGDNTPNVDPVSGIFSFDFIISDELVQQLNSLVAPCDFIDREMPVGDNISNFLGAALWQANTRLQLHRISLDGLYFYLRSTNATFSDLFEHIEIVSVTGSGTYTTTNPVYMAEGGNPRLFPLPSIRTAPQPGSDRTIRVVCRFNCDEPDIFQFLQTATDARFPFEIGVNYNCNRGEEVWTPANASLWLDNGPYAILPEQLTWNDARTSRCSNDVLLGGYEIDAPTFDYSIDVIPVSPINQCTPEFEITVTNESDGTLNLEELTLTGFSQVLPVDLTTILTSAELELLDGETQSLGFYNSTSVCITSQSSLGATVRASGFCADCEPLEPDPLLRFCLYESGSYDYTQYPMGLAVSNVSVTASTCSQANGSATVTAGGNCGTLTYTWYNADPQTSPPSIGSGATISNQVAGNYWVVIQDNTTGCTIEQMVAINDLSVTPNLVINQPAAVCQPATIDLTSVTTGSDPGTFTYWEDATATTTPLLNPSAVDVSGTYYIKLDFNGCVAIGAVTVTIVPAPNAGTNGTLNICSNSSPEDLFNSLGGSPQTGGSWPPGVPGGIFDPAVHGTGTFIFTYMVNGTGPCPNATADVTVNVTGAPDAGTNGTLNICSNSSPEDLFNSLGGSPQMGGSWPAGVPGGIFDPAVHGTGTFIFTYMVNGTGPCPNATADVTVNVTGAPDAGMDGTLDICSNSSPADLFNSLGGTPQTGGSWPPGVPGGIFDPAVHGTGTFNFSYTVNGTGPCPDDISNVTVNSYAPPVAVIQGGIVTCGPNLIPGVRIVFSGTGPWTFEYMIDPCASGPNQTFGPITVNTSPYNVPGIVEGDYTILSLSNPYCSGTFSGSARIEVGTPPNAGVGQPATFCSNDPATSLASYLTGNPDGGGTWYYNNAMVSGTFDPAVDPPGQYSYVVSGPAPCNGTGPSPCPDDVAIVNVTVNQIPSVFAGNDQSVCMGSTLHTPLNTNYGGLTPVWTPQDPTVPGFIPTATQNYCITVTDANGCDNTDCVLITVNQLPTLTVDVRCGQDGLEVQVDGTLGAPGYTFKLSEVSPPQLIDQTFIPANFAIFNPLQYSTTYLIEAVDLNGCVASITFTTPDPITFNAGVTQPTCAPNANGAISVQVMGGTAPYTYCWTGPNTMSGPCINQTANLTGQGPGTYYLTITDADNCEVLTSFDLVYQFDLTISAQVTDVGCATSTAGAITFNVGGTAQGPFEYDFNGSGQMPLLSNPITFGGLTTGSYPMTVSNGLGCVTSITPSISVGVPFAVAGTPIQPVCSGNPAGVALNITGGNAPYLVEVLLSTGGSTVPSDATVNTAGLFAYTGFSAGNFFIRITDAGGCVQNVGFSITAPDPITIDGLQTIRCRGQRGNIANVKGQIHGGTPPYTITANPYPGTTAPVIDANNIFTLFDLPRNTNIVVTVTDANGCTFVDTWTDIDVFGPPVSGFTPRIGFNSFASPSICGQNNGSINLCVPGMVCFPGPPNPGLPQEYSIDGGVTWQSSPFFGNLSPGIYIVTASTFYPINGILSRSPCTIQRRFVVEDVCELAQIEQVVRSKYRCGRWPEDCFLQVPAGGNGSITLSLKGVPPFNIVMSQNGLQISTTSVGVPGLSIVSMMHTFSNLQAGIYQFDVSDATGAQVTLTQVVAQPVSFKVFANYQQGGVSYDVREGPCSFDGCPYKVYIYERDANNSLNLVYGPAATLASDPGVSIPLPRGNYTIVVQDCNGCTWARQLRRRGNRRNGVEESDLLSDTDDGINARIFPNPNDGQAFIEYELQSGTSANLRLLDQAGKLVHEQQLNGSTGKERLQLNHLERGVYIVQLQTSGGAIWHDKLVILH